MVVRTRHPTPVRGVRGTVSSVMETKRKEAIITVASAVLYQFRTDLAAAFERGAKVVAVPPGLVPAIPKNRRTVPFGTRSPGQARQ